MNKDHSENFFVIRLKWDINLVQHKLATSIFLVYKGFFEISVKNLETVAVDRNRADVKEGRRHYASWLNELQGRPEEHEIVFIDESGFNLWLARSRGRARAGQRAVRTIGGRKGPNFTCIMAISNTRGLIHTEFRDGGTTCHWGVRNAVLHAQHVLRFLAP